MSVAAGVPFEVSGRTVLDGTGAGQVTVYPPGNRDAVVTLQTVSTSTAVKQPTALVYKGSVASQAALAEGSYTGANDASDTRIMLRSGQPLTCAWSGGDVGAAAVYTIAGQHYPPGQAPTE